jgi:uncharacterized membrane protein
VSDLVVIAYEDIHKAEEVRITLAKLQHEYLIDLEDAVVVTKDASGKVKLHQAVDLTAVGALQGGMLGALLGLVLLNPIFGMVLGGAAGALSGKMSDLGIDDNFIKELSETLKPNTSALFILVKKVTLDKVLPRLEGTGGKVLQTSLAGVDEQKLQAVLDSHRNEVAGTPTV